MKTVKYSIEDEIISLNQDIALCESFTEKQMQEHFNTDDSKEDFMAILKDELSFYEKELNESCESESNGVDCGFADMQDFINYKYF